MDYITVGVLESRRHGGHGAEACQCGSPAPTSPFPTYSLPSCKDVYRREGQPRHRAEHKLATNHTDRRECSAVPLGKVARGSVG